MHVTSAIIAVGRAYRAQPSPQVKGQAPGGTGTQTEAVLCGGISIHRSSTGASTYRKSLRPVGSEEPVEQEAYRNSRAMAAMRHIRWRQIEESSQAKHSLNKCALW